MLYRVYIDEAGDRGMKPGSSAHFLVTAVIVRDSDDAQVRSDFEALRQELGRHRWQVLHFRKLTHSQKIKAAQDIGTSSIAAITNVIICKRHLHGAPGSDLPPAYMLQPDPMYLFAMRMLLERISWYVDEHGRGQAHVTFAHLKRFKVAKLHEYRDILEGLPTTIRWQVFEGRPFHVSDMKQRELLQVADACASALFKAVELDEYGNRELRYMQSLDALVYRRGLGAITSYGYKVFPTEQAESGGSLNFLRSL
jgi:Protein of unknown function (DUF3800)